MTQSLSPTSDHAHHDCQCHCAYLHHWRQCQWETAARIVTILLASTVGSHQKQDTGHITTRSRCKCLRPMRGVGQGNTVSAEAIKRFNSDSNLNGVRVCPS